MDSNFKLVTEMNIAFGNPKGNPKDIDWIKVRSQCKNIGHEYIELLKALGLDPACLENILGSIERNTHMAVFNQEVNLKQVRDSLCDINVFSYGAHHFLGINADADMQAVIEGVMSRFVKDDEDKAATIAKHAAKGVTEVYFEGTYPKMIMKSKIDQPDAPRGKFMKSASYREPVFYKII